jgi:hypothetical protein
MQCGGLVGLGVNILRWGDVPLVIDTVGTLTILEESQTRLNVDICRVQIGRTLVRIKCIRGLIIARFVLLNG